ncbi:MAG TPA: PEGA domain-containing protein [Polyangiaceae bacterium]
MSKTMMRRSPVIVAMVLFLSSLALPGAAQDLDARRTAYDAGLKAMVEKNWPQAHRIFSELWAEQQTYDVAVSLGQAELHLERHREAAEHVDWGLRHLPPREKPGVVQGARDILDRAKQHVTVVRVTVEPEGAEITVDGKTVGSAPLGFDLYVEPGSHSISARAAGFEPADETFEARPGDGRVVTLRLRPASASTGPEYTPHATDMTPPPREPRPASSARPVVLWTGVAVTTIAVTAGIVFAINRSSANADAEDLRRRAEAELGQNPCANASTAPVCRELEEKLDDRNDAARLANISFGAGIVAGVATAVTWLAWPSKTTDSSAALRLFPVAQKDGSRLMLYGTF